MVRRINELELKFLYIHALNPQEEQTAVALKYESQLSQTVTLSSSAFRALSARYKA